MLILAHRGASADAPENTLPAFAEAVRQGADGIELDAMVCGSGEVVVCHDEDLMRLAGEALVVARTPLGRLRRVDVGSGLGFGKAFIPTLHEVIDLLPAHFFLNLELKCDAVEDRGLSEKVGALVRDRRLEERVVLSSFNPLCLLRVAAKYPELPRGFLLDPDKNFFVQARMVSPLVSTFSIHPEKGMCTAERVAGWNARGLKVAAWTVDEVAPARALREMGVAYCITNRPGQLRRAL